MRKKRIRKDIIRTKIKEIEESIRLVGEHLPNNFKEFSGLGLIKDGIYKKIEFAVEMFLTFVLLLTLTLNRNTCKKIEFAVENVFDVCAIINTDLELGIPANDEDVVGNLVKNEVLDEEMREKLKSMKGFRNIVMHKYGKIDDKLAFKILKERMHDFYEFVEKIETFLNQHGL